MVGTIVMAKLDGAVHRVEIPATKMLCPKWGHCKATEECPIATYTAIPGSGFFTPVIPDGGFCARYPKPVSKIPSDPALRMLRLQWEKLYTVEKESMDENGALLVSLSKTGGVGRVEEYRLHRYFTLGDEWQVSVDFCGSEPPEAK